MKIAPGPAQHPKTKAFVFLVTMAFCSTHCPALGKNTPTEALLAVKKFFQKGPGKTVLEFGVPITFLLSLIVGSELVNTLMERRRRKEEERRQQEERQRLREEERRQQEERQRLREEERRQQEERQRLREEERRQQEERKPEKMADNLRLNDEEKGKISIEDIVKIENFLRHKKIDERIKKESEREKKIAENKKNGGHDPDQDLHLKNVEKSKGFDIDTLDSFSSSLEDGYLKELEKIYIVSGNASCPLEQCTPETNILCRWSDLLGKSGHRAQVKSYIRKNATILNALTGKKMELKEILLETENPENNLEFLDSDSQKKFERKPRFLLYEIFYFIRSFRRILKAQQKNCNVDIEEVENVLSYHPSLSENETLDSLRELKCFQGGLWDYVLNNIVQQIQRAKDNLLDPILAQAEVSDFMTKVSGENGDIEPEKVAQLTCNDFLVLLYDIARYLQHPEHFVKNLQGAKPRPC